MSRNRRRVRPNPKGQVSTKSKAKEEDVKDEEISAKKWKGKKSGNDPAWYASDPVIMRDAASYPFSYNTGATEIHDPNVWNNSGINHKPSMQIPGICSLHVYPAIGTAVDSTDPINVAAQSVYSFVRHANSGHSNYDAPDLMMYILAMANMFSFLVWCERLYGYALTYDQRNRYLPADLIRHNNVDVDDLRNNLANFRFWINTLVAKMASFAVPATMSIFSRMTFMYSNVYIEGTSIKEQLYQYVPEGFYKFGIDSDSLGNLTFEAFDYTTIMTVNDIMTYGDALFDAIWSQEDFGIMSGDILKAYGDRIIKIQSIPEMYNIIPSFDPMVLTQMKNADMCSITPSRIAQTENGQIIQGIVPRGFMAGDKFYGVTQTMAASDVTKMNVGFNAIIKDYRILTVDADYPTPEVVMEATRLKVAYDAFKAWYKVGTELITRIVIASEPTIDIEVPPIVATFNGATVDEAANYALFHVEEAVRNFHYIPRVWFLFEESVSGKVTAYQSFDIDNFTVLTFEDVRKLHEAAVINMFAVPSIGKVQ